MALSFSIFSGIFSGDNVFLFALRGKPPFPSPVDPGFFFTLSFIVTFTVPWLFLYSNNCLYLLSHNKRTYCCCCCCWLATGCRNNFPLGRSFLSLLSSPLEAREYVPYVVFVKNKNIFFQTCTAYKTHNECVQVHHCTCHRGCPIS